MEAYNLLDDIICFAENNDRDLTDGDALDLIAGYERRDIEEVLDIIADGMDEYDPAIQSRLCGILDDIREVLDTLEWDPPEDWTF